MYLYQLVDTSYDCESKETVRDFYLLQHEKNMTDEEFHKIVDKYHVDRSGGYIRFKSIHSIQYDLCHHEGFRVIPRFTV